MNSIFSIDEDIVQIETPDQVLETTLRGSPVPAGTITNIEELTYIPSLNSNLFITSVEPTIPFFGVMPFLHQRTLIEKNVPEFENNIKTRLNYIGAGPNHYAGVGVNPAVDGLEGLPLRPNHGVREEFVIEMDDYELHVDPR